MPVYWLEGGQKHWLHPRTIPQSIPAKDLKNPDQISKDFLINVDWKE